MPEAGDPLSILNTRLALAVRAASGTTPEGSAAPALAPSKNPKLADFQFNGAMALAKAAGTDPRTLATKIVEHLDVGGLADPPEIAGPGFINIRLRPGALAGALESMDVASLGVSPAGHGRTCVVDLCGVNLAKEMHVGHIRATVIGDALARLHERLGWRVIRQNHFGDWGLPIAMVTAEVKKGVEAGRLSLGALTLRELEALYKAAQKRADADEQGLEAVRRYGLGPKAEAELSAQVSGAMEAREEARRALVALQAREPAYVAVWKEISRITLAACFENCRRLGARVTDEATAGESSYADELGEVVDDLARQGLAEESDGALVVRLDDAGIKTPVLVRKRDGGFLYATTDFAAIRRRVQNLGASRVIYAVDARQSLQFQQVFAGCRKAGYTRLPDGTDAELIHAAFGTILGDDGTPFKTRSGENVRLADLLDEAVERAERAVAEKNPSLGTAERREIAEAIGMGAIKYADLSNERIKDYIFSFDRMLAFEGNTGPYLQYAVVRIRSIFRKAAEQFGVDEVRLAGGFSVTAPEEKAVALELLKYPGVVKSAAEACEPHRVCGFLYALAQAFSTFFAACPVLQAPDEAMRNARLRLCRITGRVLSDGLETLGIRVLDRM